MHRAHLLSICCAPGPRLDSGVGRDEGIVSSLEEVRAAQVHKSFIIQCSDSSNMDWTCSVTWELVEKVNSQPHLLKEAAF